MRGARAWLAIFGGWTGLAVFYAVTTSLTYRSTGRPGNWSLTFRRSLSEWWLWALLTPAVAWLARRFPLHGRRRWRNAAVHIGFAVLLAFAKTMVDRATFAWLTGFRTYILLSTVALHFTIYFVIVAAAHGLEYYRRSREREQLEARLADTRLQLLNMQLQPHFLFNTLNTISELVHDDPEAADRMIAGLSELLRKTLDLGEAQDVTLDEELRVLDLYLDIQRIRFGDRLQVLLDVPGDARTARVPPLLLQPLVENSIRHGLAAKTSAGRIEIRARRAQRRLTIDIVDDGESIAAEHPKGIGLSNVRARLEALYGDSFALELTPATERGTHVRIDIPSPEHGS